MNPGPELDALVAERVMGCKLKERRRALMEAVDQREYETARKRPEFDCGCEKRNHNDLDDYHGDMGLKDYSTSIVWAWEVVESMKTKHRYIEILAHKGDLRWICRIYEEGSDPTAGAGADTAPHAICLAALKACGVEVS